MLQWVKKFLGTGQPAVLLDDPDFGRISFFPNATNSHVGFWQMHDTWDHAAEFAKVACNSIPGTVDGPASEARTFLLTKRQNLRGLWTLCAAELAKARARWPNLPANVPLTDCFVLTSLGLDEPISDPPEWSIGFESVGKFWVFVEIALTDEVVDGHTCDT